MVRRVSPPPLGPDRNFVTEIIKLSEPGVLHAKLDDLWLRFQGDLTAQANIKAWQEQIKAGTLTQRQIDIVNLLYQEYQDLDAMYYYHS